MDVIRKVVVGISWAGIIGYVLTSAVFLFADEFVYKHGMWFGKVRDIFAIIMLVALVLNIIINYKKNK